MNIAMVGTGYVGLVSGVCFADFGFDVTCVDKDESKIRMLQSNVLPIYEPGLETLVSKNVDANRLTFSTDLDAAVKGADVVFIAVGTPTRRGDGHADLTYVFEAAEEIANSLSDFTVVVTKSTVPVGTGDEIEETITRVSSDAQFAVVSNPEFLKEGSAISDFKSPDRIIIGFEDERAKRVMEALYQPLSFDGVPLIFTDRRTSELIKYAANAFLATKITFINEIADLCENVGADVRQVSKGIGLDKRIGSRFLAAGPGFGGSCFPKDTLALMQTAASVDCDLKIVDSVIRVNTDRKIAMADRIVSDLGGDVNGKTICILGLTFKPDTDDMRDAPSLDIVPRLVAAGARLRVYDPKGMDEAAKLLGGVSFEADVYSALKDADAMVLLTEWDEFRALDLERVRELMASPRIIDLRNVYSVENMRDNSFEYTCVGFPTVDH